LLPPGSIQGQVSGDVLFRLGVVEGPFAMVWGLIAALFYAGYRIDRDSYERVQAQLKEQRSKTAT
jgi:Na+/melibiose symporter-like transporter